MSRTIMALVGLTLRDEGIPPGIANVLPPVKGGRRLVFDSADWISAMTGAHGHMLCLVAAPTGSGNPARTLPWSCPAIPSGMPESGQVWDLEFPTAPFTAQEWAEFDTGVAAWTTKGVASDDALLLVALEYMLEDQLPADVVSAVASVGFGTPLVVQKSAGIPEVPLMDLVVLGDRWGIYPGQPSREERDSPRRDGKRRRN